MVRLLSVWVLTFLIAGINAGSVYAQSASKGKVMLVLDASGSMWGRVEEREKILIAREVVGEMIDQWDPALDLGLVAYGHRIKGDCTDIETLISVGGDLEGIRRTVNNLQPRGKTPLSAAVRQAAEHLRYTEDKATVILVSDGKETCDLDPCEVGRNLEQLGVDFTAHVIGFDIAEADRAGLACLASETGGQYFDARKTDDLKAALVEAVEKIKQQPDTVIARLGQNGREIVDGDLEWRATDSSGQMISATGAKFSLPPEAGVYQVEALLGKMVAKIEVSVQPNQTHQHVAIFEAGDLGLQAKVIEGGESVDAGAVSWSILRAEDETEVATATGSSVERVLAPGLYQVLATHENKSTGVEVLVKAGERTEAEVEFEIEQATLAAPANAPVSKPVEIAWAGPNGKGDFVTIVPPDAESRKWGTYFYTSKGTPGKLAAPDEPGVFEIRYLDGSSNRILARRAITIDAVPVTIDSVDDAAVSSEIEINWLGPDGKGDYITVVEPDADRRKYGKYQYTSKGSPIVLLMPDVGGAYELRYVSGQSGKVLGRRAINITDMEIALDAPESAGLGSSVSIGWKGPDAKGDYIDVAELDSNQRKYENYTYTRQGSPLNLLMPDREGVFEIRYVSGQSGNILAKRKVTIEPVPVTLEAPDSAAMGADIEVDWQGPGAKRDFISVAAAADNPRTYVNYSYTKGGNPVQLQMPDQSGPYEIRYVSAQSNRVLARRAIMVEEVQVTMAFPGEVSISTELEIAWNGPDGKRDYITVIAPDLDDRKYGKYTYTKSGTPLKLIVPDQPGVYEVRYVSGQSKRVLARKPVTVKDVSARISSLGIGKAGDKIKIYWLGPANRQDKIAIANMSDADNKMIRWLSASESPLSLKLPTDPGRYELRYVSGQSSRILARKLFEVVAEQEYAARLAEAAPGKLTLRARRADQAMTEGLSWQIYGVDGVNTDIHNSTEAAPELDLPTGIYRINLSSSAGSGTEDVIVDSGQTAQVEILIP